MAENELTLKDLAKIDDVSKECLLETTLGLQVMKMNLSNHNHTNNSWKKKVEFVNKVIKSDDEPAAKVILLVDYIKKYYFNNQINPHLLEHVKIYVELLQSSTVKIELTFLYFTTQNKKAQLKIVAAKSIQKNILISELKGKTVVLTEEELINLNSRSANFSILCSPYHRRSLLMLGTIALLNHDYRKANCKYEIQKDGTVFLRTIKEIEHNEELTCFYGKDYFGSGLCLCYSCQKLKKEKVSLKI